MYDGISGSETFFELWSDADYSYKKLFHDPDVKDEFINIDAKILRQAAWATSSISSASSWERFNYSKEQADTNKELIFFCDCLTPAGKICNRGFSTYQQLRTHVTMTKPTGLSTHGLSERNPIKICVLNNACQICRQTYSSRVGAQLHLAQCYVKGRCLKGRTHFDWAVHTPVLPHQCPFFDSCGFKGDNAEELAQHILLHLADIFSTLCTKTTTFLSK